MHAQPSALMPSSRGHARGLYSPRGGLLADGGGFSMEPGAPQMPFSHLGGRRRAGSVGQYPSAVMVITPKTDGAGSVLCDPLQVSSAFASSSFLSFECEVFFLFKEIQVSRVSVIFEVKAHNYASRVQ